MAGRQKQETEQCSTGTFARTGAFAGARWWASSCGMGRRLLLSKERSDGQADMSRNLATSMFATAIPFTQNMSYTS